MYVYLTLSTKIGEVLFLRDLTFRLNKDILKSNGRNTIAAHHFLPECIIDDNISKFLIKFLSQKVTKRIYTIYSCNYVADKAEYPHGSKSSKLWYSIPDQTNEEARQTYLNLNAIYEVTLEIQEREQKRLLEEKQKRDRERQIILNTKFDIYNSIESFAAKELFDKYQRQCELEIKTLHAELSSLKEKSSMDALRFDNLQRQYDELQSSYQDAERATVTSIIKSGGISGHNLTNAEFHRNNLTACRVIFGFSSFSEMKTRLACMFREFRGPLSIRPGKKGRFREGEGDWDKMFPERNLQQLRRRDEATRNWEDCLITIMRFCAVDVQSRH